MIRVETLQIPGLPTQEPRRLYIYLPRDYARSKRRYPVLYMFDGHNVFYNSHATYGKSWGMRQYLSRTELPLMVVAVECNHEGDRRLNEYAPWDLDWDDVHFEGLGFRTLDWMTQELKPGIDSCYRTLPDREHTLIAGSSMGGLMTLCAMTAYNGVFSRGAALSPSIWAGGEQLQTQIRETRLEQTTRIWMDLGTAELPPEEHGELSILFDTASALTASGADVTAMTVPGALHNEAAWEKRIPLFMDYLFSDLEIP